MLIAHIADVHLGYRTYSRLTSAGLNQREADVFRAFQAVLEEVAGCDLVVIAGDLFHSVRPSNFAIFQTYRLLASFRNRSDAPIVIVGGNHDTPKSLDSGCILELLGTIPGVYVQHRGYQAVVLEQIDTAVYCLPYFGILERSQIDLRPHDQYSRNVLVVHGTLEGVMKDAYDPEEFRLRPSEMNFSDWTYVAFGHYHIHSVLEANACYSGALEYTSTNIWEECPEAAGPPPPKGYVTFDTDRREIRHHPTPGLRTVRSLGTIDGEGLSAQDLMAKIEGGCACLSSIDGCIARLVIEGFPDQLRRELDWARIREMKSAALHLDIAFRPGRRQEQGPGQAAEQAGMASLQHAWSQFTAEVSDLPSQIEREKLKQLGIDYLTRVEEAAV